MPETYGLEYDLTKSTDLELPRTPKNPLKEHRVFINGLAAKGDTKNLGTTHVYQEIDFPVSPGVLIQETRGMCRGEDALAITDRIDNNYFLDGYSWNMDITRNTSVYPWRFCVMPPSCREEAKEIYKAYEKVNTDQKIFIPLPGRVEIFQDTYDPTALRIKEIAYLETRNSDTSSIVLNIRSSVGWILSIVFSPEGSFINASDESGVQITQSKDHIAYWKSLLNCLLENESNDENEKLRNEHQRDQALMRMKDKNNHLRKPLKSSLNVSLRRH